MDGADHRLIVTGTGGAARQATRVLAAGLAVGLLFGAVPARQWAEGHGSEPLTRAARGWEAAAEQAGLNRPYRALHAALRRMVAIQQF